jgi:hypothetical protein
MNHGGVTVLETVRYTENAVPLPTWMVGLGGIGLPVWLVVKFVFVLFKAGNAEKSSVIV